MGTSFIALVTCISLKGDRLTMELRDRDVKEGRQAEISSCLGQARYKGSHVLV